MEAMASPKMEVEESSVKIEDKVDDKIELDTIDGYIIGDDDGIKIDLKEIAESVAMEDDGNSNTNKGKAKSNGKKSNSGDTTDEGLKNLDPSWGAVWNTNILAVKGVSPDASGNFKKFLVKLIGNVQHKIRPRHKDDKALYIHFKNPNSMKIARKYLNNQTFKMNKLRANVVTQPKATPKRRPFANIVDEPFEKQGELKLQNLTFKLINFCAVTAKKIPEYNALIQKRKQKYKGTLCPIDPIIQCEPDEENRARVYAFTIGASETGKYGLQLFGKNLVDIESSNIYCPEHVMKAAMVFEKLVQVPVDLSSEFSRWKRLVIHTNTAKELMLTIFWRCPTELEDEETKRSSETLKEFYTNGEGKDCEIASLHLKTAFTDSSNDVVVMGKPHIEDTVCDITFPLLSKITMWNCSKGAEILCKTISSVLQMEKESKIVATGCNTLIGLYLAKNFDKVMLYPKPSVELTKQYAELNEITNLEYFEFDRNKEISFTDFAKRIKYKDFCAVLDLSLKAYAPSALILKHLRKVEKLKKILVIEMNITEDLTFPLMESPVEKGMGNPFFPSKVIALNLFAREKTYVKLTLFERVSKTELANAQKVAALGKQIQDSGNQQGYSKRQTFKKPQDRQYSQQGGGEWRGRQHDLAWNQNQSNNMFQNPLEVAQSLLGESLWNFPNTIQQRLQEVLVQEEYRRAEEQRRQMEEEMKQIMMERRRAELQKQQMEAEMKQRLTDEIRRELRRETSRYAKDDRRGMERTDVVRVRELEKVKTELRGEFDVLRNVLADTLREAAIPQLKQVIAEAIKTTGMNNPETRFDDVGLSRADLQETYKRPETPPPPRFEERDRSYFSQNNPSRNDRDYHAMKKDRQYPDNWKQSGLTREQELSGASPPSLLSLNLKPPITEAATIGYVDDGYEKRGIGRSNRHFQGVLTEPDTMLTSNSSQIRRDNPLSVAQRQFGKRQFRDEDVGSSSFRDQSYNLTSRDDGNVSKMFDNRTSYDALSGRVGRYNEQSAGIREPDTYARRDNPVDLRRSGQTYSQLSPTTGNSSGFAYDRQMLASSSSGTGTQYSERFLERDFDSNAKRIKLDDTLHQRRSFGYGSSNKLPSTDRRDGSGGKSSLGGRRDSYSRW